MQHQKTPEEEEATTATRTRYGNAKFRYVRAPVTAKNVLRDDDGKGGRRSDGREERRWRLKRKKKGG